MRVSAIQGVPHRFGDQRMPGLAGDDRDRAQPDRRASRGAPVHPLGEELGIQRLGDDRRNNILNHCRAHAAALSMHCCMLR